MDLSSVESEMRRLSVAIDEGIETLKQQSAVLSQAEHDYRRAKAEAWVQCPNDKPEVKAGERAWTAARREAWVNAETAVLRQARDRADHLRDAAREAIRARQGQLSSLQTLLRAHQAEADFARTGPGWDA